VVLAIELEWTFCSTGACIYHFAID